ncbi:MAG: hypothetical protein AAGF66_04905 [Cyanobacteria bacterium P01_H01_bin.119]
MVEAKRPSDAQESQSASSQPAPETKVPAPVQPTLAIATLDLAAQDVRTVLREQREESQLLTTKLNILFVTNGALLTSLSISRLILSGSIFNVGEVVGFLLSFTLLVRAFLPRQVAVTPNLQDREFLENYLLLPYEEYQLQMLVNLSQAYNANKQRLDDVSQTLKYAAYATWATAVIMLAHILSTFWTVGNYDLQLLDML